MSPVNLTDLGLIAPVIITALSACVVLLLTVAGGWQRPAPSSSTHLSVVGLAGLAIAAWLLWTHSESGAAFGGAMLVDGLGVVFGLTTVLAGFVAILLSESYLREHGMSHGEFIALILLSVTGMLILAMAGDLLTLFIGIELMSLAVYVLAGYRRASRRSQEAAFKYFIYGAYASGFILFGMALLYGEVGRVTGSAGIALTDLGKVFIAGPSAVGWAGVAMVLGGFLFKIAAVPFHMWAPDVYEGAPTPATGFMAVGVKAAAFAGLVRFAAATFLVDGRAGTETMVQVFEVLAILSMVLGNLVAIRQKQIKRMLAYSSIAHAGYILVGVAALIAQPSLEALQAISYYLFGYTAMTLGAFGVVLAFERREDRRLDLALDRFTGVGHRYPALGLAMALFMFSLAGIPPTAGFFGKLSLLSAAIAAGRVPVVIIAVLTSAMGAYYYLRVLVVMYMKGDEGIEGRVSSRWLSTGLWLCAAATLWVGLMPEGYLAFTRRVLEGWLS